MFDVENGLLLVGPGTEWRGSKHSLWPPVTRDSLARLVQDVPGNVEAIFIDQAEINAALNRLEEAPGEQFKFWEALLPLEALAHFMC